MKLIMSMPTVVESAPSRLNQEEKKRSKGFRDSWLSLPEQRALW